MLWVIKVFVYGVWGLSLLIESTDSIIMHGGWQDKLLSHTESSATILVAQCLLYTVGSCYNNIINMQISVQLESQFHNKNDIATRQLLKITECMDHTNKALTHSGNN